jgi:hypothetical protein
MAGMGGPGRATSRMRVQVRTCKSGGEAMSARALPRLRARKERRLASRAERAAKTVPGAHGKGVLLKGADQCVGFAWEGSP